MLRSAPQNQCKSSIFFEAGVQRVAIFVVEMQSTDQILVRRAIVSVCGCKS